MKNYYRVKYVKTGELESTRIEFSKDGYKIIKIEQFQGHWIVMGVERIPYEEHVKNMKELVENE